MIKKLFNLDYHPRLVDYMASNAKMGAISSNIIIVAILFFVAQDVVPSIYLLSYTISNIFVFIVKIYISNKVLEHKTDGYKIFYIKSMIAMMFLNAFLYQAMLFLSVSHGIDEIELFILIFMTIALISGSINITAPVFIVYVVYIVTNISMLLLTLLFLDNPAYNMVLVLLIVFLVIFIVISYKYYKTQRGAASLETTFQTIYDKSSDGIILIKNKRYIDCNDRILKMFKYESKTAFLNSTLADLAPKYQPDNILSTRKIVKMMTKTQSDMPNKFQWLHKTKDNREFWCEVVLIKIILDDEPLLYGVWRDIDDRKKLELKQMESEKEIKNLNTTLLQRVEKEVDKNRQKDKQLLEQSRLAQMGEMMSMLAHQWRQPLAAIGATSMAMELKINIGMEDKKDMLKNIKNISEYAQHLSSTIDSFRDFFKTDKKKTDMTYGKVLENVLKIIEASILNKNIKIVTELNSDVVFHTFEHEFMQVLLNIIKNAEDILIDKRLENAKITIVTDANTIIIKDNAGGVAEDIMGRIFDPYFSTKLGKNGTGLGLYMSKTIIEEHCEGELSVSNDAEGAVFKITLTPTQVA